MPKLDFLVHVVFSAFLALSNIKPTDHCALPYWWVQQYSLPPNFLQGVQPKSTYSYREYLQVFDPNNYVHTKEYSEYTWWENNSNDVPPSVGAKPDDRTGITPHSTKTRVRGGNTKGGTLQPGKTKVRVESTTLRTFEEGVMDANSPTEANSPAIEVNTTPGGAELANPEAERNEDESENIQLDDLNRNVVDSKMDLLQEETTSKKESRSKKESSNLFSRWYSWGSDENDTLTARPCNPLEADIHSLRSMIEKMFNFPREHTLNEENKEKAREDILNKFKEFGLQVWTQNFTIPAAPNKVGQEETKDGVNLVGVIPGLNRGQYEDGIVLVGAHYDTVPDSNGVDDNGSGLAVMLEVAKMLTQPRCRFNNTLMFVAFDLQENGAMGSNYFVDNYLIPEELKRARAHFQGAFILDGIMNFNNNPNSQELPVDYAQSLPGLRYFVNNTGNRGDFLAMISRNHVDNHLSKMLMDAWQKLGEHNYKLYNLAINMGNRIPSPTIIERHLNFLNSDHATFWYHNSTTNFPETLNAVLLTDTGPFRGQMKKCYHSECDDLTAMSPEKLRFAKKTANALSATLVEMTRATAAGNRLHMNKAFILVGLFLAFCMNHRI